MSRNPRQDLARKRRNEAWKLDAKAYSDWLRGVCGGQIRPYFGESKERHALRTIPF